MQNEMRIELTRLQNSVLRSAYICRNISESIVDDRRFLNRLYEISSGQYDGALELMYFHRTEIKSLERMLNSNDLLAHIRIHIDSDDMIEMMPALYKLDRARWSLWYESEIAEGGQWFFDYGQSSPLWAGSIIYPNPPGTAALLTRIRLGADRYAILEVSAYMNVLFPALGWDIPGKTAVYVGENKKIFPSSYAWLADIDYELLSAHIDLNIKAEQFHRSAINGIPVMLGVSPLNGFPGTLVLVSSMQDEYSSLFLLLLGQSAAMLAVLLLSVMAVRWIITKMMKRFYIVVDSVKKIQQGDLLIAIPDFGQNEIGELGRNVNIMADRIQTLIDENVRQQLSVRDSRLKALQNQINAHFLYNVLETIKMMAEIQKIYQISDAIATLGNLLRYNLDWTEGNVTLAQEIEYAKHYLTLINLRYDFETRLIINADDKYKKAVIPKMTLQPIIENTIVHGFDEKPPEISIYLEVYAESDDVFIELSDSGCGMDEGALAKLRKEIHGPGPMVKSGGNGVGLKNIHDRIRLMYGANYGIDIASEPGRYTKTIIKIPFRAVNDFSFRKADVFI